MGRVQGLALTALAAAALGLLATSALAEGPSDTARAAIERTQQAKSARLAVTHRFATHDRVLEQRLEGKFAGGDRDVIADGEGGKTRQVAVGSTLYERRPDRPGSPWHESPREEPASDTVFGPLTLADGTHIADPKLHRSTTSYGTETLPQGDAEKLVLDLDMTAVATAMQLTGADAERLAQMEGTLTLWVRDGAVARNALRLVIPGDDGPTTLETTVDLADLDAAITIAPPTDP